MSERSGFAALACAVLALGTAAACEQPAPQPSTNDVVEHPLDALLEPVFAAANEAPRLASPTELCARLSIDLLGRPMPHDEAERTCSGRELEDVILEMQGTDEYLVVSQRHWADRFQVNDIIGDWRSIKGLYELVDALHRSELHYRELAVQAIAHPGIMTADFDARARVRRVFRTFMGRKPSAGEEAELAALFRPWLVANEPDPDFPTVYRLTPVIMGGLCAPLARCSTTLWGGASLEMPNPNDYVGTPWETIDDETRAVLRVPGELFVAQPTFAEAAADEILDRYLDWDEGERDIRTAGHLFPEVRQALADFISQTGDYPAAERLVLTSWLYTQPAARADDVEHPLFAGPTKPVSAEVWLAGLAQVSSYNLGSCDNRYGDGFQYFQLLDAYQQGMLTLEEHNEAVERLHEMRGDRNRLATYEGVRYYDYQYIGTARMLGGCPGFQATRQRPVGVSYALLQEGIAQAMCAPGVNDRAIPDAPVTVRSAVEHLLPRLLSRPATDDDTAILEEASGCPGPDCDEVSIVSSTCTTLLGSAEYLFR